MVPGAADHGVGTGMSAHYQLFLRMVQGGYYVHVGRQPLWKSYSYIENITFQYMRLLQAPAELIHRKTFYLADYEPIDLQAWCDAFQRALDVRPIRHVPVGLARALARFGDAVNAVGIRSFPFNSFRLNNVLTQYRFDTAATKRCADHCPTPWSRALLKLRPGFAG